MKIFAGNLPYEVTEDELRQEFETFGEVTSVNIMTDKYSGQSRGFGFVEMPSVSEGQAAIAGLNGKVMKEQTLNVNAARSRSESRGSWSHGDKKGSRFVGKRQRKY